MSCSQIADNFIDIGVFRFGIANVSEVIGFGSVIVGVIFIFFLMALRSSSSIHHTKYETPQNIEIISPSKAQSQNCSFVDESFVPRKLEVEDEPIVQNEQVLSTNLPQAPSSPVSSPKELLENSIPSTPVSKEMGNPFGSPKPKKKYELEETPLRKSARLQQKTNHA